MAFQSQRFTGAVLALALACGALSARAAEQVRFLLPTLADTPGLVVYNLARHLGYYKEAGLEVTFQQAKGGVDVAQQVGANNADMGAASGDTALIVRSNGVPVKTVALLGGGSLMVVGVRKDSGIKSLSDLKSKTITTFGYQDSTYYAMLGTMASQGLKKTDVDIQAVGPAGLWQLVAEKKAVGCVCVPDTVALLESNGVAMDILPSSDSFPSLATAVIASDRMLKERPKEAAAMVSATLRAMRFVRDSPEKAADSFIELYPKYKERRAYLVRSLTLFGQYALMRQAQDGESDATRLASVQKFYMDNGIIRHKIAVSDAFSNDFLSPRP